MVRLDRGCQLESLREARVLTDVTLVSGDKEVPAHRLILSLHSAYFRTLFQSRGFSESCQSRVPLAGLQPHLLAAIVTYIYTGHLELDSGNAVDLLEAAELLQLEDQEQVLRLAVSSHLEAEVTSSSSLEAVFPLWNTAVTYSLPSLLEKVLGLLAEKIEQFATCHKDRLWLNRLGWQELQQVVSRPDLCVQSEAVLLNLVLDWAEDKVESPEDLESVLELLRSVRITRLDKRYVRAALARRFPDSPEVRPRLPMSKELRSCHRCTYLVEYKLAKTQLRNIEDFIDQGQKSLFLGFSLGEGRVRRLPNLSSMGSMVTTASGNYGRPITRSSAMFQQGSLVAVLGGWTDSLQGSQARPQVRGDILLYDTVTGCWKTSLKQHLRPRPRCRLAEMLQVGGSVYLVWQPGEVAAGTEQHNQSLLRVLLETENSDAVVERLDLGAALLSGEVSRQVVAPLPLGLHQGLLTGCTLGPSLYLLGQGAAWSLDTTQCSWTQHPPPIGSLGSGRPVVCCLPPLLCLVGARPQEGEPTNSVQLYDTEARSWRRLPNLATRLTPVDMVSHCGQAFLVGWQPARQNFIQSLTLQGDQLETEVLVSGLEGVWSRGLSLRGGRLNTA